MKNSTTRTMFIATAVLLSLWLAATVSPCAPQQSANTTLRSSNDAADTTTRTRDDRFSIQLSVLATDHNQGAYGAQKSRGSAGSTRAIGGIGSAAVALGFFDSQDRDNGSLCMNGTGSGEFDAPHVWRANYQVLPAEPGEVSLKVEWQHTYAASRGQAEKIAGDTRTITMKEGETHILDFVDIEPDAEDYCYRNASIAITAKVAEDPAMKHATLEYDLWLRHIDSDGQVQERQFHAIGSQGELVDFRMLPLRFAAVESFYSDGADIESILEISGAVRGRLRSDGSIDLHLSASRWIGAEKQGAPRRGGVGDGGTKVFSSVPGETVSMILPVPRGANCVKLESSSSRTDLDTTPHADKHCVDNTEFFGDHQDQIVLTVNRVQ